MPPVGFPDKHGASGRAFPQGRQARRGGALRPAARRATRRRGRQPVLYRPRDVHAIASTQDWRVIVGVFWITQLIEGMGVSQVFALLPAYLRDLGVPETDRLPFVGLYSSLMFVVGLPLVPLWGVWADKISRKAVIVRSALVEAVVFAMAALAREPWQLALAVLLIGFQLGNTGVMLAGIRDVSPRRRLGTTIALFGAAGPIGFAAGPTLAGLLIDGSAGPSRACSGCRRRCRSGPRCWWAWEPARCDPR